MAAKTFSWLFANPHKKRVKAPEWILDDQPNHVSYSHPSAHQFPFQQGIRKSHVGSLTYYTGRDPLGMLTSAPTQPVIGVLFSLVWLNSRWHWLRCTFFGALFIRETIYFSKLSRRPRRQIQTEARARHHGLLERDSVPSRAGELCCTTWGRLKIVFGLSS